MPASSQTRHIRYAPNQPSWSPRRLRYPQLVAQVMLEIPDDLLAALETPGQELARSVFEAVVLEAYRERKLSTAQLRRLLGFETGYELDGFLKDPPSLVGIRS